MLLQEAFISGKFPHYRQTPAKQNIDPVIRDILHPEGKIIKSTQTDYAIKYLQEHEDWMAVVVYMKRNRSAFVEIVGKTQKVIDEAVKSIFRGVKELVISDPNKISLNFVFSMGGGASINPRSIDIETWDSIKNNYSESIIPDVDYLMNLTPDKIAGKLMILHGPTGTGKTTLLSCLAGKWKNWCQASYIIDPQRLLNDPQYMYNTLLGESFDDPNRWKLIIMEDSDDETRSDAKLSSHGPGLSSLLNITDGLLGQGRKLVIAITTNEKIANLDPAIVRPGRLLKEIMVPELNKTEAQAWAVNNGTEIPSKLKSHPLTLAELYAIKRGENPDPLNKKRVGF